MYLILSFTIDSGVNFIKSMTMSSYKVTYFATQGLAEPISWLLAYGGVDFEDKRVNEDEWKALKPTMPFYKLLILEVDGKRIHQSTAICRYLAKQFGLSGKDDWENLEIDAIVDSINDLRIKVNVVWYEKVVESKAQKLQVAEETAELFIPRFEEMARSNGGYLVVGKLTWADIALISILEFINFRIGRDVIDKAEELKALRRKIQGLPQIKAWVEKRPKTND